LVIGRSGIAGEKLDGKGVAGLFIGTVEVPPFISARRFLRPVEILVDSRKKVHTLLVLAYYWWFLALYLVFCAWENTRLFVKPPAPDPNRKKWPLVSILIPARNEEFRIKPCLEGMVAQDYPRYEILVLDDRSTDRTFQVAGRFARGKVKCRVFRGQPLPAGWLGKPWACQQLSRKARGEWLFFTDADTWHHPDMLKRTVQMAERGKADVLSLFTRQVTRTWMEALVIPVMAYTLLAFLPVRWSLGKGSFFNRFAGVSGQFVFIKQKAYRALGGHERVKGEIVEDLNFGKEVVQGGYRLVLGDGSDFSFCRMYTNAREVWEGFSKNFFPALKFSPWYFLNAFVVLVLDGVAPFLVVGAGPGTALFKPALALAVVSLGVRALQAWKYGFHKGSVWLHPLGCLLFALIGLNSIRWFWSGRGHWKGRALRPASA
jgi:chlorobactene glucosyltransferase